MALQVDTGVAVGLGTVQAPPWRTVVSWVVLHPVRDAVLVIDTDKPPFLPSTELPGEIWLGDARVFTGALAELGVDAVTLFEADRRVYGPMSLSA